jgi:hypothetical protein
MKVALNRCLALLLVFVVFFPLTGCSLHVTKRISDKLDHDAIYTDYNVHPSDLSSFSKCNAPPSVKIVNIENRIEDYETLQNGPSIGFINPKEMMDSVCLYLKNGFEKSRIKVDDQSTKVLQVKMIDLKSTAGAWTFGSYFKMELIIPETKLSKFYEAKENAGNGLSAPAYAIHRVTRQIIDDPVIQDYILCR